MSYKDLDSTAISNLQGINYTAGSEPWNKVLNAFSLEVIDTEVSNYICDWSKWHGIYRSVPMVKAINDKTAKWTIGKGYRAKPSVKQILDRIRGNGKDTFNTILINGDRVMSTCGDFWAEIIKDKASRLINLKPLNPGSIKTTENKKGIITKYEQVSSNKPDAIVYATWEPNEIFHISQDRIGDEIHGIPTSEVLIPLIKKWELASDDMAVIFHRYIKPLLVWQLDTDDTAEIAAFKAKAEQAVKDMENMYVPKDTANLERMSIPQYSTLDPIPWIKMLYAHFIVAGGVPEVILGHSQEESEATSKILYLAFQQTIEARQLLWKEQIKAQLGLDVEFEFPASIDPSIMADSRKNTGHNVTDNNPAQDGKDTINKSPNSKT